TGTSLIAINVARVVNKWGHDNRPLVTRVLESGEKWPNFEKLNAECPQSEWHEAFGKMQGPWSGQHCLYFVDDLERLNRFTWPSAITTAGSSMCVDEPLDQIKLVQRVRGQNVYPVTVLGHTNFKTAFGIRQRPYLMTIPRWVKLDGSQQSGPSLATNDTNKITASTDASAPAGTQTVSKPTAKEVTKDEIAW